MGYMLDQCFAQFQSYRRVLGLQTQTHRNQVGAHSGQWSSTCARKLCSPNRMRSRQAQERRHQWSQTQARPTRHLQKTIPQLSDNFHDLSSGSEHTEWWYVCRRCLTPLYQEARCGFLDNPSDLTAGEQPRHHKVRSESAEKKTTEPHLYLRQRLARQGGLVPAKYKL